LKKKNFCLLLFEGKKSQKELTKQQESRFSLLFLLDARSIWIRIQEAQKHTDPTDQDPQHCLEG
jgi:hypothetical protein